MLIIDLFVRAICNKETYYIKIEIYKENREEEEEEKEGKENRNKYIYLFVIVWKSYFFYSSLIHFIIELLRNDLTFCLLLFFISFFFFCYLFPSLTQLNISICIAQKFKFEHLSFYALWSYCFCFRPCSNAQLWNEKSPFNETLLANINF